MAHKQARGPARGIPSGDCLQVAAAHESMRAGALLGFMKVDEGLHHGRGIAVDMELFGVEQG